MKIDFINELKNFIEERMSEALKMTDDNEICIEYRLRARYRYISYSVIKECFGKHSEDFEGLKKYIFEKECYYYKERNDNIRNMGYWDAYYDVMMEVLDIEAKGQEMEEIEQLEEHIMADKRLVRIMLTKFSHTNDWYEIYDERYKAFSKVMNAIENLNGLEEIRKHVEEMERYYYKCKDIENSPENNGLYYAYSSVLKWLKYKV